MLKIYLLAIDGKSECKNYSFVFVIDYFWKLRDEEKSNWKMFDSARPAKEADASDGSLSCGSHKNESTS